MTETELAALCAAITPPDEAARAAAHAHWASLAKPLGGLGALETVLEDAAALAGSAKLAGAGLAQHPPHRVRQIGLARAVGADDAGDTLAEAYPDLIGETLETLNFQFLEHHVTFP